jgi:hypothetical protein
MAISFKGAHFPQDIILKRCTKSSSNLRFYEETIDIIGDSV